MKHLLEVYDTLCKKEAEHASTVYNYTIPQAWDTYGYPHGKRLRNNEMIVHPYHFYTFAIHKILQIQKEHIPFPHDRTWVKQSILSFFDLRTNTSWDHDRSGIIGPDNLYHLSNQGTFLKAIILLPLFARCGINTFILQNMLETDKPAGPYDFANPHAVISFHTLSAYLTDPMLHELSSETQLHAFIEACHSYNIRVIIDICPALVGRDSLYLKEHPEWFYWIKKVQEKHYAPPNVDNLPNHCIPSTYAIPFLYDSPHTKQHIQTFIAHPKKHSFQKHCIKGNETVLSLIEKNLHLTTAPLFSDIINAEKAIDKDLTIFRFYEQLPDHCPAEYKHPYLLQDIIRVDLFPGKQPILSLWNMLIEEMSAWIDNFAIDGLYVTKPYLLPTQFLEKMKTQIHTKFPHIAILMETADLADAQRYAAIGFDAVSGNSAYKLHDVHNLQYHTYAYQLLHTPYLQCSASEYIDTPRIVQYSGNETLAKLIMLMNLFLPNTIPTIASGQISFERQPQFLSSRYDQGYLHALSKDDPRYHRQSMLDRFYYAYTRNDFHIFINQMETFATIRKQYRDAIVDIHACIPIDLGSDQKQGIGFAYSLSSTALLAVCSTNVHDHTSLYLYISTLLWKLPFSVKQIVQLSSSADPYVHALTFDTHQNLLLEFLPGEVKLIELRS